jgi:hypothetical protein
MLRLLPRSPRLWRPQHPERGTGAEALFTRTLRGFLGLTPLAASRAKVKGALERVRQNRNALITLVVTGKIEARPDGRTQRQGKNT